MKAAIPALVLLLACGWDRADAQVPIPIPGGGINFKNESQGPILVQGSSRVNNMVRNGQPILILPGKSAWDVNVPPGVRLITVYDANNPARVLLQQQPVQFFNRDLYFSVVPVAPNRVDLKPRPPGP